MGLYAHRTDATYPAANSSGANSIIWRVASWVLKGTHLSVQLEHPYSGDSHKSFGWTGCLANQVPLVVHPTRTSEESHNKPQKGWVLEALDLKDLKEWPESEQKQARELLLKWEHLFACSDLDLGKTVLIKHNIELTDWTPFKEHY